jgi:hypothetical protein
MQIMTGIALAIRVLELFCPDKECQFKVFENKTLFKSKKQMYNQRKIYAISYNLNLENYHAKSEFT